MYMCPVCGYGGLRRPPEDFLICSCCGTEFGNDDAQYDHDELRARWLKRGTPWFSRATPPPANWNVYDQLKSARLLPRFSSNVAVNAVSTEQKQPAIHMDSPIHMLIGTGPEVQWT